MTRISVALLICALLLAAGFSNACIAQGSTGGSFGKTDQELSGGLANKAPSEAPSKHDSGNGDPQFGKSVRTSRGPKTFANPTVKGIRVDYCMTAAEYPNCGPASATVWCRMQGRTRATDFKWELGWPAYRLGDRIVCGGPCGRLTSITCE